MPGTDRVEIRTLKVGRFCVVDEEAYKILSISKSKPGKHGSAKARLELESIFTKKKISHVGTVTDSINVPMIEKGTAMVTHMEGAEVHAMNMRDHSMMILPMEDGLNIEAGKEIMWMEALGRYKIIRDH
ncbi:MAG: translation initiation factor IF-5A [Euryarchaeota archaeon]|nr:translation initiation factor IF-5A [Euryarchaeota archaeon]MEC7279273.1 translation initiation factor IF-5A [Candidatus Thermoplasmatota archaeon]MEC7600853.1 translation initiation factor IF-5A [Candidatus Thermoplasmatota archaeon]MEC8078308.1 translation initiation factor IF-5A [Candidatus Thermoplasmatota archaeon]MEC8312027.1 translation initiation factor IF-5A [Candidatus Thermoplasmatota archaeon]